MLTGPCMNMKLSKRKKGHTPIKEEEIDPSEGF